ncbi:MAG TPA: hypothetical protein VHA52_10670, partial [Candidatus Babeliaceae bacterium]|nr:hypothetical protein [Candidatus Babeliaceae bacterium]
MDVILLLLGQLLLYLPLIIGAYVSFRLLGLPDFSIEAAYLMGAILAVKSSGFFGSTPVIFHLLAQCLIAVFSGGLVGVTSGILTQYLRLNHALSSIITLGLFRGLMFFFINDGRYTLQSSIKPLQLIAPLSFHPELITLFFIVLLSLLAMVRILNSQLGYCIAAYGQNNQFFNYYPISSNFVVIMGLVLGNAYAGLSGYLVGLSHGYIDLAMGVGIPLMCLSAIIVGSLLARKNKGPINLMVPITGIVFYFVLQQVLVKAG